MSHAPTYSVAPQKKLGQNFLTDKFYLTKIVRAIAPEKGQTILEIGPGTGALTSELLQAGAYVSVIEKDERCLPVLETLSAEYPSKLTIHIADALKTPFTDFAPEGSLLVGNLPYNIGTQIVLKGLEARTYFRKHVYLLQKEVVARICAASSTADWGRLAIACQQKADCQNLFDVPPGAFFPPPKVVSAVVCLNPNSNDRNPCPQEKLEILTRAAFGQRRKMIRTSLKQWFDEAALFNAGLEPTERPENLTLADFARLANKL